MKPLIRTTFACIWVEHTIDQLNFDLRWLITFYSYSYYDKAKTTIAQDVAETFKKLLSTGCDASLLTIVLQMLKSLHVLSRHNLIGHYILNKRLMLLLLT